MRHLELHILQSVPVACLNRDDLGSPKTAVFGGVQRARVSSQCWKRAIREYSSEILPQRFQGERTRLIVEPLRDIFVGKHGIDEETALSKAKELAEAVAKFDAASAKKGKLQTKTLFFTSRSELEAMALGVVNGGDIKKHAFPTRVGMNRNSLGFLFRSRCLPHTRGDEPSFTEQAKEDNAPSPHAWG